MSDLDNDIVEVPQEAVEDDAPENFFIDILTGNKESASPKDGPQKMDSWSFRCAAKMMTKQEFEAQVAERKAARKAAGVPDMFTDSERAELQATFEEVMKEFDRNKALWVERFGDDRGFAEWFGAQVARVMRGGE